MAETINAYKNLSKFSRAPRRPSINRIKFSH